MEVMIGFAVYLVVIMAGLAYAFVLGALGQ